MERILQQIGKAIEEKQFSVARKLIVEGIQNDPQFIAQGRHITLAHYLVQCGDWELIDQLIPSGLNTLQHSGWLRSIKEGRPVNAQGEPIPWFTYPAIDFLQSKIQRHWRVFEWGSGYSTMWWSARVAQVVSAESDQLWMNQVASMASPNVTLRFHADEAGYVNAIANTGTERFDVAVVDGDFRNACARKVVEYVKPSGLILFDNSDGPQFNEGIQVLMDAGWRRIDFFGGIASYVYKNCTSIFFKDDAFLSAGPLPSDIRLTTGRSSFQNAY